MKRPIHRDPVIWLIFAVAVGLPSFELAGLRFAAETPARVESQPPFARVQPAGEPRVIPTLPQQTPAPEATRQPASEPAANASIDSTSTRIVTATRAARGDLAAVLEESGRVTLWKFDPFRQVGSFQSGLQWIASRSGPPPPMEFLPLSPGANSPALLALGGLYRVHVWNPETGAEVFSTPKIPSGPVIDVSWTGFTQISGVCASKVLWWWRVMPPADSALLAKTRSAGGAVHDVDYNIGKDLMAMAAVGGVHIRERRFGRWTLVDTSSAETDSAYIARLRSSRPLTPEATRRLGTYPYKVAFGAGGALVASLWNDHEIRVHATGAPSQLVDYTALAPTRIRTMQIPNHWSVWFLTFSPNGKLLAASGDSAIYVWSLTPDTPPVVLPVARGPVVAMFFAPHGRSVFLAGRGDQSLREIELPEHLGGSAKR